MPTEPYATYADVVAFADERTIKDLLSDQSGGYSGDLASDPKLTAMLAAASGLVEAAAGVSDLYSPDDLAALTGNAQALLKHVVAGLAIIMAVRRRPEKYGSEYWRGVRQEIEDWLEKLRKGQRLFDDSLHRAAKAGLPKCDGPTALDLIQLNLLPSRVHNYFPNVGQRLPIGRQNA